MKTITVQVPDDCEVQVIKKKERGPIIRTYQDLIDNKIVINNSYWISEDSIVCVAGRYTIQDNFDKNVAASEKVVKSMLAMAMISQLIPYYGGEITDEEWDNLDIDKFTVERTKDKITPGVRTYLYHFLAFHTAEQRDEFLKYNKELVKDYLMID